MTRDKDAFNDMDLTFGNGEYVEVEGKRII